MVKKGSCSKASVVALVVLLTGALVLSCMALFMPQVKEQYTKMTAKQFGKSGMAVTVIHAKWCGHCKTLLAKGGPWAKLKAGLPGVRFVELDEATLKGKAAVKKYDVSGFPDIRIVSASGASLKTYTGERSEGAMRAWVLENVPVSTK